MTIPKTASLIRNTLATALHFMDHDKHIDLQDDPGNDLDFFLEELNRLRSILKLEPYVFEKRTKMTGRGDWYTGHSEKVRFILSSNAKKAPTKSKTVKPKTPKAAKTAKTAKAPKAPKKIKTSKVPLPTAQPAVSPKEPA